jgi:hypothetical protein
MTERAVESAKNQNKKRVNGSVQDFERFFPSDPSVRFPSSFWHHRRVTSPRAPHRCLSRVRATRARKSIHHACTRVLEEGLTCFRPRQRLDP